MSTVNSAAYATQIGQPLTGVGLPTTDRRLGARVQDGKYAQAVPKKVVVEFDVTNQALSIGDVVNVALLPKGAVPVGVLVLNDTATTSGTLDIGSNVGGTLTAHYFSSSALSLGSIARQEGFTNVTNVGKELAADTVVTATVAGANLASATVLKFIIEYFI